MNYYPATRAPVIRTILVTSMPSAIQLVLTIFLLIACITWCETVAAKDSKVLIIHSYSQGYPWTQGQHEGFISTYKAFAANYSAVRTEYLDTKRAPYSDEYGQFFKNYLEKKYQDFKPALLYVTDDDALTFALTHGVELFPSAKIIFSGVNNYQILKDLDRTRVTGIFERKDIAENLDLLKYYDPNVTEILVVGDGSSTFLAIKNKIDTALKTRPEISPTYVIGKNKKKILDALKGKTQKYLFLTTIGSITDVTGTPLTINEIVKDIVDSNEFMIFSMEDAYVLEGVLGGYVASSRAQGQLAAEMAGNYLSGQESILEMSPVTKSPNRYLFDYHVLEAFDVELPEYILENATIIHEPPSFYVRNRLFILMLVGSLALMFIATLLSLIGFLNKTDKASRLSKLRAEEQARKLFLMHQNLADAQSIAHLGNWEWHIDSNTCVWSDELYRLMGLKPQAVPPSYEKLLNVIPDDARKIFDRSIQDSLKYCCEFSLEHPIKLDNGKIKYVRHSGKVCCDISDRSLRLTGTVLDITTMKHLENAEIERARRIERYQDALIDCSNEKYNTIEEALQGAAEAAACTLETDRTSIWLFNQTKTALTCRYFYSAKPKQKLKQNSLSTERFPIYMEMLNSPTPIAITDARTDERTQELVAPYLEPNDIHSVLDVPIFYDGEVTGVVCHEVVGKERQWEKHEIDFSQAISNIVALSLEIDKRKQIETELEHLAYHDALTKLPNRSLFHDRLEQTIRLSSRSKTMAAILFLDLDNFKEINDTLGHEAGDEVLIQISKKLQNRVREVDTVCRLGGDEFSMILGGFKNLKDVRDVVLKLYKDIQIPLNIDNKPLPVTGSIGVSVYPDDGLTSEVLLRNADSAMYRAKEDGRNSFHFYTKDMTEQAFERVLMESELRNALANENFEVFYQPQYLLSNDTPTGFEALVRWQHPRLGLVYPDKFLPLMESMGLGADLDQLILKKALTQFRNWINEGLQPGTLSVNFTAKHIYRRDFFDFIKETIKNEKVDPKNLIIEISESDLMDDADQAAETLNKIVALGINLALDNFGTGYSCFPYLTKLPISRIVIDKSFVCDALDNSEHNKTINGMIGMATSMHIDILAEGIEKEQQRQLLKKIGCRFGQGFLYERPLPPEEIVHLIQTESKNQQKRA